MAVIPRFLALNILKSRLKSSCNSQVEGCNEDLTNLKRYHKRHRVCDLHLRATRVRISGVFQRFCQKCSRFQEVCPTSDFSSVLF